MKDGLDSVRSIRSAPSRTKTPPVALRAVSPPVPPRAVTTTGAPRDTAAEEPLLDLGLVRDLWQFVRNACVRRWKVCLVVVVAFAVVGAAAAIVLPRSYYSETKLLADRNVVMPLLGNPSRKLPNDADTPTRLAADRIMNYDNLQAIVVNTNLLTEVERTRAIASRVKKKLKQLLSKPLTDEERMEELIWTLRSKMSVTVGEGTITIGAYWSDPTVAFRIVQAAQQSFIEERQAQELALVSGSIAILEKNAEEAGNSISGVLDSLARDRAEMTEPELRPAVGATRRVGPSVELLKAQSALEATVRSIADLEQLRNRRLAELQNQLSEQLNTYGAAHPQIESTQQLIRGMQTDSPQLLQLRKDEQQLRDDVERLGGATAAAAAAAVSASGDGDQMLAAAALRSIEGMRSDSLVQEKQQYGRSRLRIALTSYASLLEHLDDARMELQTTKAAFKFKYGVLVPANVPRDPVSTNPVIMFAAAIILGLCLAIFTAVALDMASGRVLESWQIERSLGLPVLGEASLVQLPH